MEFAPFISLWPTQRVLRLSSAELAEVFCGLWDGVGEEHELYAAQWFSCLDLSTSVSSLILLRLPFPVQLEASPQW
jgi:hypothetical protein